MSYNYADISNYEFKKTIGEGNFAKVKLSIFKPTKEEFAIKIINKKKLQKKMKNTIFRENDIISQLQHPNIITVFEILEDSENYYIIMENCKNGELFDYIVAHQNLDENEASIFFYQLIKGVEYIHSKNIVHRDLKPENLLLTENNILKIIDFGLSHPFDGTEMLKTKCGSPSYAAPEIITGTVYDGFKTDVWCCGVILYAMLCGFLPFEGENDMELFKSIVECDPEIPRELSKESKKLIRKIFTPNPNKRITIPEIKKTDFYLKGKELYNLKYGSKVFNKKISEEKKLEFIKEFYNDLCEDDFNQKRNNNNNEIQIVIDGEKNNIFEAIEETNDNNYDRITIGSNEEEKEDALRYIKKNNINIFDISKLKHIKDTHTISIKENEITNKDSQDNNNTVENNENESKERNSYMQTCGNVERIKNPKMKIHLNLNFNHNLKKNNIFNSFRKKLIKDNNLIQKKNLDNQQEILRTDSNEFKMQTINQKPQIAMNLLNFNYINNTSINNLHKINNNDSNQMNQFKLWPMPNLRENIIANYKTPKKTIFLKINDVNTIKPILSKNHKNKKLFLRKSPHHFQNFIKANKNDKRNNQSTSFKRFCDNLIDKKYDSKFQKSNNITSNDSNNNKIQNNYDEKVINSLNNEILINKNSKSIEIKKINNHNNSLSIRKNHYTSPWKNFQQAIMKKGKMTPSFDKMENKLIKTNVINSTPKREPNLYYNNINININTINVNGERSNNFNEHKLSNAFSERRKMLTLKNKEDNANFINSPNANSINVEDIKSPFFKNKNNKKINFSNLIAEAKKKNTIYYYDNKRHTNIIATSVGPHHKMKDGGLFLIKTGLMQRNFGNNNLSKNLNERKGNPKSEEKIKNNNSRKNAPFLNNDIYSNNIYNIKIK